MKNFLHIVTIFMLRHIYFRGNTLKTSIDRSQTYSTRRLKNEQLQAQEIYRQVKQSMHSFCKLHSADTKM